MTSKSSKRKPKFEKVNSVAIYAYAIGLFSLVVVSSQSSLGIILEWPQMIILGFVLVLLLYRYFDFIKLGGFLELQKQIKKSQMDMAVAKNEIHDLTEQVFSEESEYEKEDEELPTAVPESVEIKEKVYEKKGLEKKIQEDISEQPTEEQTKHCLRLLRDRRWDWRTDKTLMRRTRMNKKQFSRFLDDHPEVVESYIDDVSGNKLYKIED